MSTSGIARVIMVPVQGLDISSDLARHPTISGWASQGLASFIQIEPIWAYRQGVFQWEIKIVIITTTTGDATIVAGLSTLSTTLGVTLETWSYQVTYG